MHHEEEAQIHILEMLTLFWLFFMSATFLIRIQVPDAPSVAHDAALELTGDDAFRYGLGLEAEVTGENRLSELLDNGELDEACLLLQELAGTKQWDIRTLRQHRNARWRNCNCSSSSGGR